MTTNNKPNDKPNDEPNGKPNEKHSNRRRFLKQAAVTSAAAFTILADPYRVLAAPSCSVAPGSSYDFSKYTHIDPALIHYKQLRSINTQLTHARAIATTPHDHFYIVGDKTLIRYKPDFTIDQQIQFDDEPRAITIDADNNTLIAFSESVKIFNPDHQLITQWPIPVEGEWITSIAADEENVYIAVTRSRKGVIARCTRAGKLINRIGEKNTDRDIQGIIVPSPYFDIALGKESLIWAANPGRHLIEAYTPNGDLAKSWGKTSFNIDGFCGCCNPTNFAILANRDFVTCEKGIKRVKISHPDGSLQSVVAPPQLFDNSPTKQINMPKALDVAVNSHNHIFILDQATATVHVMIKK